MLSIKKLLVRLSQMNKKFMVLLIKMSKTTHKVFTKVEAEQR